MPLPSQHGLIVVGYGYIDNIAGNKLLISNGFKVIQNGDEHDRFVFMVGLNEIKIIRQLNEGSYHQPRCFLSISNTTFGEPTNNR